MKDERFLVDASRLAVLPLTKNSYRVIGLTIYGRHCEFLIIRDRSADTAGDYRKLARLVVYPGSNGKHFILDTGHFTLPQMRAINHFVALNGMMKKADDPEEIERLVKDFADKVDRMYLNPN